MSITRFKFAGCIYGGGRLAYNPQSPVHPLPRRRGQAGGGPRQPRGQDRAHQGRCIRVTTHQPETTLWGTKNCVASR